MSVTHTGMAVSASIRVAPGERLQGDAEREGGEFGLSG